MIEFKFFTKKDYCHLDFLRWNSDKVLYLPFFMRLEWKKLWRSNICWKVLQKFSAVLNLAHFLALNPIFLLILCASKLYWIAADITWKKIQKTCLNEPSNWRIFKTCNMFSFKNKFHLWPCAEALSYSSDNWHKFKKLNFFSAADKMVIIIDHQTSILKI